MLRRRDSRSSRAAGPRKTVCGGSVPRRSLQAFMTMHQPTPELSPSETAGIIDNRNRQKAREANTAADTSASEREIDSIVYKLYGFNEREAALIQKTVGRCPALPGNTRHGTRQSRVIPTSRALVHRRAATNGEGPEPSESASPAEGPRKLPERRQNHRTIRPDSPWSHDTSVS